MYRELIAIAAIGCDCSRGQIGSPFQLTAGERCGLLNDRVGCQPRSIRGKCNLSVASRGHVHGVCARLPFFFLIGQLTATPFSAGRWCKEERIIAHRDRTGPILLHTGPPKTQRPSRTHLIYLGSVLSSLPVPVRGGCDIPIKI